MDPDLVRIILVVLGVLLIVGIYLWDRFKRATPRTRRIRRSRQAMSIESAAAPEEMPEQASAEATAQRAEPTLGQASESIPEMRVAEEDAERHRARAPVGAALDPEPSDLGEWSTPARGGDPQFSMDLNFDAHGDGDYLAIDPALLDEVERKIVVINLAARDGSFSGPAIERACAAADLVPGDMSIYHRREGKNGRVLFSMASMVEPGSFPVDDMHDFSTPGLTLFTQLPGVRDGIDIYNEMLATANRLASQLRAELQDERHNKLTRQMQEHTRESIIEHRHKIRLARSRH
jgi:cell division protein ZipA